jgi:hypothetical protein
MTEPDAGINLPVLVTGFQRSWNTHGVYPTTYLGVRPSKWARMATSCVSGHSEVEALQLRLP